jgi:hypothetical protein
MHYKCTFGQSGMVGYMQTLEKGRTLGLSPFPSMLNYHSSAIAIGKPQLFQFLNHDQQTTEELVPPNVAVAHQDLIHNLQMRKFHDLPYGTFSFFALTTVI